MLKISVITVCYNSAKTLAKTLQSVHDQDWPYVEHIVIDGGSQDNTLQILDQFSPGLSCVVSEPDNGIYDAMNKGVYHATGDVICFLNSDDHYAHSRVLSKVATNMRNSSLDALFGDVVFFEEGNPDRIIRRYRSGFFHPKHLAWGWIPAHPAFFLKRHFYSGSETFKQDYRIAGDFEFIARVFTRFVMDYKHIPEVMVKMQTGGVSTASGLRGRILHNRELLRACHENEISTNIFKILSRYPLKLRELLW